MPPKPQPGQAVIDGPPGMEEQKLRLTAFERLPIDEVDLTEDTIRATVFAQTQFNLRALAFTGCPAAREFNAEGERQTGRLAVAPGDVDGLAGHEEPHNDFLLGFRLRKKEAVRQALPTEHRSLYQLSQTLLRGHMAIFRWGSNDALPKQCRRVGPSFIACY